MTTLEKVRKLEQYIAIDNGTANPVLDLSIDKMLSREIERLEQLRSSLSTQLSEFERTYGMDSHTQYRRYEQGELGDAMDFMEWAATTEMVESVDRRLALLIDPV